jgi:serine/threonine protein kinase/tetratricopeptide (TPR) repeat protein
MPVDPKRAQAVFLEAVGYQGPAERAAVLDRECQADQELRRSVETLLRDHDVPDSVFDRPFFTATASCAPTTYRGVGSAPDTAFTLEQTAIECGEPVAPSNRSSPLTNFEGPGTHIGPYKLVQRIGEGGMGAVYLAEQELPVHRHVALKIIKPGMDSEQVIARFEAERQALAMMDHPNIARVFDAGTTDSGRPYFVMELVRGAPLLQYCDDSQLTPRERLELFVPICQAIQHAHQKGVIHRDIKPSNVLVALYDGKPAPKVIDFGIAKATDQRLTEYTMYTQDGSIVGTLEYMSPEQAELSAQGVDTRSDIYSLGVLLYELLTGSTPLERERLREAGYAEILRRIKDEEPPRPSTRLGAAKATLGTIAANRRTEPARLPQIVRGELDWIVMKALEKDRARRYETASGLAHDVQHYLDGEAVDACPPSAGYRLRKFARKYRAALVIASAFAALLVLGAALSTWQAIVATQARDRADREARRALVAEERSREERDRAVAAGAQARGAEAKAKSEGEKASRSAAEAYAVLGFFKDHVLAAARPEGQEGGLGKDVTLRAAVSAAEPKIAKAFQDQPIVEAYIRDSLGMTYRYLGDLALSVQQLERALELRTAALGPEHPDTLSTQNNLALAYQASGRSDRAIALFERTLAVESARLGADHPDTLITQNNLALTYRDDGQWDRAIALFERTLAVETARLGADHPDTLTTRNNLALTYRDDGQWDRAIALFEQTLATRTSQIGADHPDTLLTQQNLAMAYREAGRWDRAITLFEQTLAVQTARLGADHPYTLLTQNNLAPAYLAVGQVDRAIALLERTAAARAAKLGADHPSTLSTQNNLALAYQAAGRLDQAIALFERTLADRTAKHGADHPRTLTTKYDLAAAYAARGDTARAESMLRDVLAARKQMLGAGHPEVAEALSALGADLLRQRKWAEAEPLLRESLAIWDAKRRDAWSRFETRSLLGESLLGRKEYSAAEPLLLSGYDGLEAREATLAVQDKPRLSEAAARIVRLYEAWGQPEKAQQWRVKRTPSSNRSGATRPDSLR